MIALRLGILVALGTLLLPAQELRDYEKKVTEFTLPNGLHFVIMERHQAPVISFHTYVNVGSAQDPAGQTGMTHLLQRLAFKGTENIGTRNWATEKKALDELDDAALKLEEEKNLGARASGVKVGALEVAMRRTQTAAELLGDPDEFARVIDQNGGHGLACTTSPDTTEITYELPSNRIELWFLMESQRLAHPVLRDFYREREQMIIEEQNTVEARALPKLQQIFLATAFQAHPYRNPLLGWSGDVANLRLPNARAFVDTYFVASNMIIGIVGDVDPANVRRLAERYFGVLPEKPRPPLVQTVEPQQFGPKTVTFWGNAQPLLLVGYKRPPEYSRDDAAFDVIQMILARDHTSWMYKELVEQKKMAQSAEARASFPAGRNTNLFVFTVAPTLDHTPEDNQRALDALLTQFSSRPVDAQLLDRVKNEARANIARVLGNNHQLAALLPEYVANFGNWRKLFTSLSDFEHVTAEDVQRVVLQYFVAGNRTVAYLTNGERGRQ